jgi:N-methylhydantoinase A
MEQADGWSDRERLDRAELSLNLTFDLRYKGQSYELNAALPRLASDNLCAEVTESFHKLHEQIYGFAFRSSGIECVTFRVRVENRKKGEADMRFFSDGSRAKVRHRVRPVWFEEAAGFLDTPIISKWHLSSTVVKGPAVIEQFDATTILLPGQIAKQDAWGNIQVCTDVPRRGL